MIYPYHCKRCGVNVDRVCSLREYEANPVHFCFTCQEPMDRVVCAPRTLLHTKPFEAFRSPVDGSIIASDRDLREHNKRNNVVQLHEGYDEKGVQNLTNVDYQKKLDAERVDDLKADLNKSLEKLDQGYKPVVAHEDDPI